MRQRSIYVTDELWRQVKIEAASRGVTSSQVVVAALEVHFGAKQPPKAKPEEPVK